MTYSVSPKHIELDFESDETIVFDVTVTNTGNRCGMYKIKTNGKQAYSARPRAGLIASGETISVCIKYKKERVSDVMSSPKISTDVLAMMARDLVAEETLITESPLQNSEGKGLSMRVEEFASKYLSFSPKSIAAFVSKAWEVHSGHESASILKITIHPSRGLNSVVATSPKSPSATRNIIIPSYPTLNQQPWSERTISLTDVSHALTTSTDIDEVVRFESSATRALVTYKDASSALDALHSVQGAMRFDPKTDLSITVPPLPILKLHLRCAQLCNYVNTGRKVDDIGCVEVTQSAASLNGQSVPWKIILEPSACIIVFTSDPCCSNNSDLCSVRPVTTLESKKSCLTVHGGLWNTAQQHLPSIKESLKQLKPSSHKVVAVTGHGKSGAYAQAIAILLASSKGYGHIQSITSVTFGAVRMFLSFKPGGNPLPMAGIITTKHYCYQHIDDPLTGLFTTRHDDIIKNPANLNILTKCLQSTTSDIRDYTAVTTGVQAIPEWMRIQLPIEPDLSSVATLLRKPHVSRTSFSVDAHVISSYISFMEEMVASKLQTTPRRPKIVEKKASTKSTNKPIKLAAVCCGTALLLWFVMSFVEIPIMNFQLPNFDIGSVFWRLCSRVQWCFNYLYACVPGIPSIPSIPSIDDIDEFMSEFDEWLQETITWTSLVTVVFRAFQAIVEVAVWVVRIVLGVLL
eukprot:TRINITY_DN12509_c0_g1_i1.p1 TRINITY_DN12509_c0_g1~~TRINITY_DN12509_c0_g1_i1.p1  ORF type:complete len:690 (+),score=96.33 TRINITY_DN12509_c0_g1_i1:115-2184(+)